MKSISSVHSQYQKYIKTRLTLVRFTGLFVSAIALGMVALQFFKILNGIWNAVSILYLCGFLFTNMAQYQDLRKSKSSAAFCRVVASILYFATLSLLVLILLDKFWIITL